MAKWNIWKKITETISKSKTWLYEKRNAVIVLCAGAASAFLFWIIHEFVIEKNQNISSGAWNLIILIVSSPVAFAIWHFRDKNNRQQIENQRKDINLKEFQKLSEWVSGAHLPEIKTVSKTTNKYNLKNDAEIVRQSTLPIEYTTEETEEYSKKPNTTDFDTFSKRDGAIALQISAIYNLLPFFRGDYGESFRLPAFDLLKSTWQIMQQDSLTKFENTENVSELRQKVKSPLGIALTHVLLSSHKDNNQIILRDFYKILPSICLAGMDFNLGADESVVINLSDLNLNGVDFRGAVLRKVNFQKSKLHNAKLQWVDLNLAHLQKADLMGAKLQHAELMEAQLQNANLQNANLQNANLQNANLQGADFENADLKYADFQAANLQAANLQAANLKNAILQGANLQRVNLQYADFNWSQLKNNNTQLADAKITIDDFIENIYPDWKKADDPEWAVLTNEKKMKAMQQFCDETGILIFDNNGKRQIMPPL